MLEEVTGEVISDAQLKGKEEHVDSDTNSIFLLQEQQKVRVC